MQHAEYTVDLACVTWDVENEVFFIRKKQEDAEINIDVLPKHAKDLLQTLKLGHDKRSGKGWPKESRYIVADARALRKMCKQYLTHTVPRK